MGSNHRETITFRNDARYVCNLERYLPAMLKDPIKVGLVNDVSGAGFIDYMPALYTGAITDVNLPVLDFGDGATKRKVLLADGVTTNSMTVSHSQSKENAPYLTDRSLIRLDSVKVDSVTGKPVTMSAYIVVALPQGNTFSQNDAKYLALSLAHFVLAGPLNDGGTRYDAVPGDTLTRILAGEA